MSSDIGPHLSGLIQKDLFINCLYENGHQKFSIHENPFKKGNFFFSSKGEKNVRILPMHLSVHKFMIKKININLN